MERPKTGLAAAVVLCAGAMVSGCSSPAALAPSRPGLGRVDGQWDLVLASPAVSADPGSASVSHAEYSRRDGALALARTTGDLPAPSYYRGESVPLVQRHWWMSQPSNPSTFIYYQRGLVETGRVYWGW